MYDYFPILKLKTQCDYIGLPVRVYIYSVFEKSFCVLDDIISSSSYSNISFVGQIHARWSLVLVLVSLGGSLDHIDIYFRCSF